VIVDYSYVDLRSFQYFVFYIGWYVYVLFLNTSKYEQDMGERHVLSLWVYKEISNRHNTNNYCYIVLLYLKHHVNELNKQYQWRLVIIALKRNTKTIISYDIKQMESRVFSNCS
jgi:hypothetical protein